MDGMIKAVIFGGKARVAVLSLKESVNELIKVHLLTPLTAACLGRALTVGAYISSGLKSEKDKFNLIINGGGSAGKIYIAGTGGLKIKGFIENPSVDLPYKNGKLDVGGAIGKDGDIVIIKDLGLKDPYVGRCELVSGEIAEDFATYLLKSEGIPNAVSLGVLTDKDGAAAAGGVIAEVMPGASEDIIVMLEDIMSNFKNISSVLKEKTPTEIMDFYFSHLDAEIFAEEEIKLYCDCAAKASGIVRAIGLKEAEDIIKERGEIEISCDYCGKRYLYKQQDLETLFGG